MRKMGINKPQAYFLSALILVGGFFLVRPVIAICPVCTVAVGAGVGLSRYFGVDDTVTGLWVGGLTVSAIMWTIDWLERKKIKFIGRKIAVTLGYYLLIVAPLFFTNIIGHPLNKMWGMDKLLLGIILGSLFFFSGGALHFYYKKKNNGKVFFPFQKVVFAISPLIILSIIFYFTTK